MGLGQPTYNPELTGAEALKGVENNLKENLSPKDNKLEDKDNGTQVDEMLKKFGTDGKLDTRELNQIYSLITGELNIGERKSTIEDSSLRRVANIIAKLGGLENFGFTKNIDYKTFISELGKEYKKPLEKNISELADGKPKVIPLEKSVLPAEMILAAHKDLLNSYNDNSIQILLQDSGAGYKNLVIYFFVHKF